MKERHENEQYFFDQTTLNHLTNFVNAFNSPCLLCAPTIGEELVRQGKDCFILDIDERFSDIPGFHFFDIKNPKWSHFERFDLILCDPPFFNTRFSHLFKAIRLLSQFDYNQPLLISYLRRRSRSFLKTFKMFNLKPTEYFPSYQTVQPIKKNEIEFYGNLSLEKTSKLKNKCIN